MPAKRKNRQAKPISAPEKPQKKKDDQVVKKRKHFKTIHKKELGKAAKRLAREISYKRRIIYLQKNLPDAGALLPKNAVCQICEIDKPLDRAHIIPVRFLIKIENILTTAESRKAFLGYKGINTLVLCKNHHYLFDHFQLTNEEFSKIAEPVAEMLVATGIIASRLAHPDKKKAKELRDKMVRWIDKFEIYLK